jgi:hypothetical protein
MTDIETKHAKALLGVGYEMFPGNCSVTWAIARFEKKYGTSPRISFIDGQYLKVGPVPNERRSNE